ncbi:DUF4229 domain-containing protein [Nocardioides daphniae]|uniref:DUF4229 domain-containing protein n=1 Tax=Nocardioides daphniae TaxID=402297 RepID=A0A4P7UI42_9ACTN|nr:DUF4229 domain-containing protein [Nocardioides daphniae]QCC78249.1 DUF4229 domain-containing protein [Nocardioides daphniae]GGD20484.1 hypothetical protein GCM10007231_19530 [Nocardioides daphniae]
MKEFWIYNLMRFLLLASSLVIVIGIWSLLADEVPLLWALILALLLSGVSSWFLLARQREALARVIQERSARASEKFEAYKARDDED